MIAACLRHPWLTLLAALLVGVAGWWSWQRLPLDAIPDLSDNQVIVWASWPGASPEDVDRQVTGRLVREFQGLDGVRTVRGLSLSGTGTVYVIFADGRDLAQCRAATLERLAQLSGVLPPGVQARLGPDATAMGQVYAFTLQGAGDPERRRFVLDQQVLPALRGVPGVAEAAAVGGVVREYHIDLDPVRLEEQGVTIDMVMMAVQQAGRDVGAMSVERSGVETMIRGVGFLSSAAQIEGIVLRGNRMQTAGLRLGDIARVGVGGAVRQGLLADHAGEQAGAIIAMRAHADPAATIAGVRSALARLEPQLAAQGLTAVPFYDRSRLIAETGATLWRILIEEILVTILVVSVFLLHARASLAVALTLPLGVAATFLMMWAAGVGANLMTLAGIAIAIGVMVDFGIVMTEAITQRLVAMRRDGSADVAGAVMAGAREMVRPLVTAGATTIIGFLPLFLLTDQAGRLFTPLAVTKTMAIAAAMAFGMLVVPVLCRWLLPAWTVPTRWALAAAGLLAGLVFGLLIGDGVRIDLDHGRWQLAIPGLLVAPPMAVLAGWLAWRLAHEAPVDPEHNPVSRGIELAYGWAFVRMLRRKWAFTAAIAGIALAGWLIGLGWTSLSWPLRSVVAAAGGDLSATTVDRTLARWFPGLGSSFLPPLDEGSLLFMPSVPAHAGLGETQRVMQIQNRRIAAVPEVEQVMGKLGRAESALDPAPIGMIETVVVLKPYREWPVHDHPGGVRRPRTLAEVRAELAATSDIPGVAPSWLQPIETRVVMLSTGIRAMIALRISGADPAAMERFAEGAERIIAQVPGAVDVQMAREGGKPYAELRLDPARLARFGITAETALRGVELGLGGMPLAWTVEGAQRYGIRLRYLRERRDDADELDQVQIPGAAGHGAIPLRSLAAIPQVHVLALDPGLAPAAWIAAQPLAVRRNAVAAGTQVEVTIPAGESWQPGPGARVAAVRDSDSAFTWTTGAMAIRSEGAQRIQYVFFNVAGRGEVEVAREVERRIAGAVAAGALPPLASAVVGRYEQQQQAARDMRLIIALAMVAMVILIYLGTRSALTTTVIIACNVTVTTAGGFIAVWLAGAEMTTAVAVGFLVLLGVMFNDGILLGTFLHQQFGTPPSSVADLHARIFAAGLRRRRAAIMTNATTLLALIPILWSDGRGADLLRPMVLPIIGGMIADLVSLFSVPVYYAWWWERRLARTGP